MGQYHTLVNYTKKEMVNPHKTGDGLKLWEWSDLGMLRAMQALFAVSNGRGGGDLLDDPKIAGRWAGDKVAIVGDYAKKGDLPWAKKIDPNHYKDKKGNLKQGWNDISEDVSEYLCKCCDYTFSDKKGWRERAMNNGEEVKPKMSIDMLMSSDGIQTNVKV